MKAALAILGFVVKHDEALFTHLDVFYPHVFQA